jgi:two-component system OmpR family sensor kinase
MRAPRSLQGRLSLWLGLGVTLIWAASAFVTAERLRAELDVVFDSALEEAAQRLLPLAVRDILDRDDDDAPDQRIATLRRHDQYFTYIVRDRAGQVLIRSHGADPAEFPPYSGSGFTDTPTQRIYSDAALQGSITIAVAERLARRGAALRGATLGLALPLALILPLSLVGVWLVVRWAMAPLAAFRRGIEARGAGDLSPIPADELPAELRPNAAAVNRLLDRLRRTLEAERSFTASAAHELRTPLAAALAQVQRLAIEAPDDPTRARAAAIEAALRRLSRLAEKLMQLARAEGGGLDAGEPIDLAPILHMLARDMATQGGGRIVLALPEGPVMARIDADAFAILARNLIENALKHGDPHASVTVALSPDAVLAVANDGPCVAPDLLARLSRPFIRGETPAGGTGLGLAIAHAIAAGAGGRIELLSPAPGRQRGFEARFSATAGSRSHPLPNPYRDNR